MKTTFLPTTAAEGGTTTEMGIMVDLPTAAAEGGTTTEIGIMAQGLPAIGSIGIFVMAMVMFGVGGRAAIDRL